MKMKLSLLQMKAFRQEKLGKNRLRKSVRSEKSMRYLSHLRANFAGNERCVVSLFLVILFVGKGVHPKSRLQQCGPMESVSGTDAEVNESTSSMSCFNEFET